jgi:hypothetical protein
VNSDRRKAFVEGDELHVSMLPAIPATRGRAGRHVLKAHRRILVRPMEA